MNPNKGQHARPAHPSAVAPSPDLRAGAGLSAGQAVQPLCTLLQESRGLYATLLTQIRARRAAIRSADFARFAMLGEEESRLVARLAELDRQRAEAARALGIRVGAGPDAALADISARLPEESRDRLDALRAELRSLIEEVRRESGVVRQAAERLSAHMAGILQTVHSALAHANVYSRGGRIAVGANVLSSLDIRS